ncbi:phosphoglucomutase/phosphomannomutase family protein [Natranaerobius trueperi]|uniref:Phosphoglucomutase n=1 Tax=Natranaerobius trueperi TaxID=759412 RepID=A0A226BWY5_9FIRM|nr:phosphoglucomutase/phosphomannomutase family protein [Natranaerobius trueperi]OWZ83533.1 phosphoglucomutase [Natranaerobius trueperi]
MGIKFGTDGWRAVIAEDFTFKNVEIVTQGIADYLNEASQTEKVLVIGYDNRFLSPEFSKRAAEVLMANGLNILISDKAMPTPVTAYSVVEKHAVGALMFTASHNPPSHNGVKFIPYYGGPALPEITDSIEKHVRKVQESLDIKHIPYTKGQEQGKVREINVMDQYITKLKDLVDQDVIANSGLKIAVDPMYGAGVGYLDRVLTELGCNVTAINNYRDPLFGGKMPEPSEKVLDELTQMVKDNNYDVGLAMDGDADRFGIIDKDGTFITANQVLSMLYLHLLKKGEKGPVTKTVSTTQMLNRIAKHYGEQILETPVGFKYIGKNLMEEGCVLGGEESGGLSILGHVPEKDGILACLLIVELIAKEGTSLSDILQEIDEKYGKLVNERIDVHTTYEEKERVLSLLEKWQPEELGHKQVVDISKVDGLKVSLDDGSWVLIRPSGTESLFRIYGETTDLEQLRLLQNDVRSALNI